MCGICGAASSYLSKHELGLFEGLMKLSLIRGEEGAGLVGVKHNSHKLDVLRTKYSSVDLMNTQQWAQLYERKYSVMLGHARWPTKGAADDLQMVHPHRQGHIVGVHNGTVTSVDGHYLKPGESDSKKVFEVIAEKGIDEAIKRLRGAYVLVWIDEHEKTLNFIRNNERPLSFAHYGPKDQPTGTLYWASDHRFLDIILRRSASDVVTMQELPVNMLVKFPLKIEHPVKPLETRELKPEPIVHATNWAGENWQGRRDIPFRGTTSTHTTGTGNNTRVQNDRHNKQFWDRIEDLFGGQNKGVHSAAQRTDKHVETAKGFFILPEMLEKYLAEGCTYCNQQATRADHDRGDLLWLNHKSYLCLDCSTTPDIPHNIH